MAPCSLLLAWSRWPERPSPSWRWSGPRARRPRFRRHPSWRTSMSKLRSAENGPGESKRPPRSQPRADLMPATTGGLSHPPAVKGRPVHPLRRSPKPAWYAEPRVRPLIDPKAKAPAVAGAFGVSAVAAVTRRPRLLPVAGYVELQVGSRAGRAAPDEGQVAHRERHVEAVGDRLGGDGVDVEDEARQRQQG